jgi:hypothetical protein
MVTTGPKEDTKATLVAGPVERVTGLPYCDELLMFLVRRL